MRLSNADVGPDDVSALRQLLLDGVLRRADDAAAIGGHELAVTDSAGNSLVIVASSESRGPSCWRVDPDQVGAQHVSGQFGFAGQDAGM